jgi:hypothetical protein
MEQILDLFASLQPRKSGAELRMNREAFTGTSFEVSSFESIADYETRLNSQAFLGGETACQEDWKLFRKLHAVPDEHMYPHLNSWYNAMVAITMKSSMP